MSLANDLMSGVAQLLATAAVGTWQAIGSYADGTDRPIFVRASPATPHRAITVSHYPVRQESWTTDSIEGIQIINRGPQDDPRPADDDADAIRAALDGLEHVMVGGHHVSLILWQSGAPLGRDDNRRFEVSQNFYLYTTRPGPNRRD